MEVNDRRSEFSPSDLSLAVASPQYNYESGGQAQRSRSDRGGYLLQGLHHLHDHQQQLAKDMVQVMKSEMNNPVAVRK
eukprot:9577218-Karenia_brevis.AAC.1